MFNRLLMLLASSLLLAVSACAPENTPSPAPNQAPISKIVFNTTTQSNVYRFDASQSSDVDGDALSYQWFIEGQVFNTQVVNHTFTQTGSYKVELVVRDSLGESSKQEVNVTVQMPTSSTNQRPNAVFEIIKDTDSKYRFNASKSSDPDGDTLRFQWFVDGQALLETDEEVSYTFAASGTYDVKLNVMDANNVLSSSNESLTVSLPLVNQLTANLSATQNLTGPIPLNVTFDASLSSDESNAIVRYEWDFDDDGIFEQTTSVATLPKTFPTVGTFKVSLQVVDSDGNKDIVSTAVNAQQVNDINLPPKADISVTPTPNNPLLVLFSGSNSSDPEGEALSYVWDIDGQAYTTQNAVHTFAQAGMYTVSLTVKDSKGLENLLTQQVSVTALNEDPVASFDATVNGLQVTLDASASRDPDGNDQDLTYAWQIDGQSKQGMTVSHTFNMASTYLVSLTVKDSEGAMNTVSKNVTVMSVDNYLPVAEFTFDVNGLDVTFDASGSSDQDGLIQRYEWTIEGSVYTGETYTHTFSQVDSFDVKLTVTDQADKTSEVSYSVTTEEQNQPPIPVILATDYLAAYMLFNGWNSFDRDRDELGFAWELSTGEVYNGQRFFYEAPSTASIDVTLTVFDGKDYASLTESVTPFSDTINRPYDLALFDAATSYLSCASSCHSSSHPFSNDTYDLGKTDQDMRRMMNKYGAKTLYEYPVGLSNHRGNSVINGEVNEANWQQLVRLVDIDMNNANSSPQPSFTFNVSGTTVTFTNTSTDSENDNLTYKWDFGDFNESEDENPTHTFAKNRVYIVKLTVDDGYTFKEVHQKIDLTN